MWSLGSSPQYTKNLFVSKNHPRCARLSRPKILKHLSVRKMCNQMNRAQSNLPSNLTLGVGARLSQWRLRVLRNFCPSISCKSHFLQIGILPGSGGFSMARSVKWLSPPLLTPSLVSSRLSRWREVLVAKITFHKTAPLERSSFHFATESSKGPKSEFVVEKALQLMAESHRVSKYQDLGYFFTF